jgi:hypothetical protein
MGHAALLRLQARDVVPGPQSQNAAKVCVAHGSTKSPISGVIQGPNAWLSWSVRSHIRNSTSRGEMSASSASRQWIRGPASLRPPD